MNCASGIRTHVWILGGAQARNQAHIVTPLLGGERVTQGPGASRIRERKHGLLGRRGPLDILKFQCGVPWLFSYVLVRPWTVCGLCQAPSWVLGILGGKEKIPTCGSSLVSGGGRVANVSDARRGLA